MHAHALLSVAEGGVQVAEVLVARGPVAPQPAHMPGMVAHIHGQSAVRGACGTKAANVAATHAWLFGSSASPSEYSFIAAS